MKAQKWRSVREEQSKRTACSRTYEIGGREHQLILYPEEVHYRDGEGKWREIDNRLSEGRNEAGEAIWRNREGKLRAEFARTAGEAPLVRLSSAEGRQIGWELEGAARTEGRTETERTYADEEEKRRYPPGLSSACLLYTSRCV